MAGERPDDTGPGALPPYVPTEDADEAAAPRRAASAEFVVQSSVGSEALLREAMDPANQSLAEALRLSYRVLQVVILVLIVLFVFSGFQTVESGQNGVLLRWGSILTRDGSKALGEGGKFSKWPYPAGEFVIFESRDRSVRLGREFWPNLRGRDLETVVSSATVNERLGPGADGYLLARGGDIVHMQIEATYDIDFPDRYVHAVRDHADDERRLDVDRLVSLALQRAAVHHASTRSLEQLVETNDVDRDELRARAQEILDLPAIDAGVRITSLGVPATTPALAIKRAYTDLQEARVLADELETRARQDAEKTLIATAGSQHRAIAAQIAQYEDAFELGDEATIEKRLQEINALLEQPQTTGEVAGILAYARSYRSTIERTLGQEALRFAGVVERYRAHADLEVRRLWWDAYARAMSRDDAEKIFAPASGGPIRITLAGDDAIRQLRRKRSLQQREWSALTGTGIDYENPYIRRGRDMPDGAGRQLTSEGKGRGAR